MSGSAVKTANVGRALLRRDVGAGRYRAGRLQSKNAAEDRQPTPDDPLGF